MARKFKRYIVNLYNGKTQHTLELSAGQMGRLVEAWNNKDDVSFQFPENKIIRVRTQLLEVFSSAPVVDQPEE